MSYYKMTNNKKKTIPTKSRISSPHKGRGEDITQNSSVFLSEDELIKIEEERMSSKYYHCAEKGCTLVLTSYTRKHGKQILSFTNHRCIEHDVMCCKCGWQLGFHYGRSSVNL